MQYASVVNTTFSEGNFLTLVKRFLLNNLAATKCLVEEHLSVRSTHIQSHTSLASSMNVFEKFSPYFEFL